MRVSSPWPPLARVKGKFFPRKDRIEAGPAARVSSLAEVTMASDPQVELIRRTCRYIETHLEDALTLEVLGERAGLSPFQLQRLFKRVMGLTPRQYADACRL